MARKETIKKGTTKDNYVIKNIFDENGKDFKTELKEIIKTVFSCKMSKNDIKYF